MKKEKADIVVRTGCDKPLLSYEIINELLDRYNDEDLLSPSTPLPKGIGSEILSLSVLKKIHKYYRGPAISKYIIEYPHLFKIRAIKVDSEFSRPEFRLTLDTEEDFKVINTLYQLFYRDGRPVNLREAFKYLDDHPELANLNRFVKESQINVYMKEISGKPVFSIYKDQDNEFIVKNRMGETISYPEFKGIMEGSITKE
jgi:spore coat polysaccharide biosynthesis protein SpsF